MIENNFKIITLPLGSLFTNCYIISDRNGKAAVIDPACDGEKILSILTKNRLTLEAVLFTHGHFDHIMGAGTLLSSGDGVTLYLHELEEEAIRNPAVNLSIAATGDRFFLAHDAHTLRDGDEIKAGELIFEVLHTPGHTVGSVCYRLGDVLFTGDTLFAGTVGRTDFPGGNYDDILFSAARLAHLPGDYRVLPGHEEETTLENERQYNPYMMKKQ